MIECRRCSHEFPVGPLGATSSVGTEDVTLVDGPRLFRDESGESIEAADNRSTYRRAPHEESQPVVGPVDVRPLPDEMARSRQTRALGVKVAVGLLVATIAIVGWLVRKEWGTGEPRRAFVSDEAELRTGPGLGLGYERVAVLPPGLELSVYDSIGSYALVSDVFARVGYVENDRLVDERPVPKQDHPFAGCRRSPIESSDARCQESAHAQHKLCVSMCAEEPDCIHRCQLQFVECVTGCRFKLDSLVSTPVSNVEPPQVPTVDNAKSRVESEKPRRSRRRRGRKARRPNAR